MASLSLRSSIGIAAGRVFHGPAVGDPADAQAARLAAGGVGEFHALARAAAGLLHGGDVGNHVRAEPAGVGILVAPTVVAVFLPAHGDVEARDDDGRAVVDVHAVDPREGIGNHAVADGALAVFHFLDFMIGTEHRVIEPQPIDRVFRQDLARGGDGGLIEIRVADERVEEDGAAVADILAQAAGFLGRECEGLVAGAVEHRVFARIGGDLGPGLDVRAEARAHFAAHPFEEFFEIVRRARPVLGIGGADLGEQDRRMRRVLALLAFLRDDRIRQGRHAFRRGNLCGRRLGFLQGRWLRRLGRGDGQKRKKHAQDGRKDFHGWDWWSTTDKAG